MQPNEFLEKLEASDIKPVNNQLIADAMAGCEISSMMGPPPGAESIIEGAFTSTMPAANHVHQPTTEPDQTINFNLPTTPGMS